MMTVPGLFSNFNKTNFRFDFVFFLIVGSMLNVFLALSRNKLVSFLKTVRHTRRKQIPHDVSCAYVMPVIHHL